MWVLGSWELNLGEEQQVLLNMSHFFSLSFIFKTLKVTFYLFMCVVSTRHCVYVEVNRQLVRRVGSLLPPCVCVLGIELRSLNLAASTLPPEPPCQPVMGAFPVLSSQ